MLNHSIKISESVYQRLKELGRHGDTFNDILQKLLPKNTATRVGTNTIMKKVRKPKKK